MKKSTWLKIAAIAIAIAVWQIVSMIVGMDMLLASPLSVLKKFSLLWTEDGFLLTILTSLLRIMSGFLIAFVLGVILAIVSGRFPVAEILLKPYIVVMKAVPVASFIILFLIWFSYGAMTVIIAFLIAFPAIYSNVLQGIKSTDTKMIEMAELYKVPWSRKLLYIYIPSIKPFLISASAVAIGMAWKAGIAAEVIGIIKNSIGERLYNAKIYFDNAELVAWTLIIIILSVLMEKLFVFVLKKVFKGIEKL